MPGGPAPRADGWPPRWLTPVPAGDVARGDGPAAVDFVQSLCRNVGDSVSARALDPLVLRGWQVELVSTLLARREDGRLRHRQALIGLPRKSGKSTVASALSLFELFCGPEGGEVYAAAGSRDQARIVFGTARRMVQTEPELAAATKVYRDAIEVLDTGTVYRVLSADAPRLEGLNPSCVVFDEVHVQPNRQLWDVLSLAAAARTEPLMVGITTAGVKTDATGSESLCYGLYQYGQRVASGEVEDDSFFMSWWEPVDPAADHTDPVVWAEANPGYGDLQSEEDFAAACRRTPEAEFRTKRLNMWVSSYQAWIPAPAWIGCADPERVVEPETPRVLAFDGSFSNDSTALVAATVEEVPHLSVVGLWERPVVESTGWRVPRHEVLETIRDYCRRHNVVEVTADPFRWATELETLEEDGIVVSEFSQTPARMTPATERMYSDVTERRLTHDGDPRLARHVENAVLKRTPRGAQLQKQSRASARKIDLAVAAVMGLDRAVAVRSTLPVEYDLLASFG